MIGRVYISRIFMCIFKRRVYIYDGEEVNARVPVTFARKSQQQATYTHTHMHAHAHTHRGGKHIGTLTYTASTRSSYCL